MMGVINAKKENVRKKQYEDLLKVTGKTVNYAQTAVSLLEDFPFKLLILRDTAQKIAQELKEVISIC